jgi:hypothetical protein
LIVNAPTTKTLTLKLYLEGLYSSGGIMNQSQNETGPQFATGITDQATVEFHDANSPYGMLYEFNNVDIGTNGTAVISNLPGTISGLFYIVIKHRNSIQTWSALPYDFSGAGPFSYDFSTAASQAYGDNQKQMPDGNFAIYCGDVTGDGFVLGDDMGMVDNQSAAFGFGYLPEDINGDGFVLGDDMGLIDNNSAAFVMAMYPGAKKKMIQLNY